MKVLLSIKPEFAEKIFDGTKKFEFRRSVFKNPEIKTVIVYASSPVQRVVGEFDINQIICKNVDELWEHTQQHAGINKEYFLAYFIDKSHGYAIEVKRTRKYKIPLPLKEIFNIAPPQSFAYIQNG
jgi:predicted transcriptional regulator